MRKVEDILNELSQNEKDLVFQALLLNYVKDDIECVFEDCEYDLWFKDKESEMQDVIVKLAEHFIDSHEFIRWDDLTDFVTEHIGDYWEEKYDYERN